MEDLAAFAAKQVKRAAERKENETSVPLQKDMGLKVKGKVIPASFLKVEGRGGARLGERPEREGQTEELVGGQNPRSEAPPRSKKGQEKREQRKCQRRSDCQWRDVEGWICQGH